MQRVIERCSAFFGSPAYFVAAVVFIGLWIAVNSYGRAAGWRIVDLPPFFYLQGLISGQALLLTIAVLIRQNRMAQMAEHRAQLDLQINLLAEHKATAILKLVDELHRDSGRRQDQPSHTVTGMTTPADAQALLHAIKGTTEVT